MNPINTYIRSITKENFDTELLANVDNLVLELTKSILLDARLSKEKDPEKAFGEAGHRIMIEIDKDIANCNSIEGLKEDYAEKLADAANALMTKAGKLSANL